MLPQQQILEQGPSLPLPFPSDPWSHSLTIGFSLSPASAGAEDAGLALLPLLPLLQSTRGSARKVSAHVIRVARCWRRT
jgi:hypothetical protein